MLTYRALTDAFLDLRLHEKPVIAHASLSAFGEIQGGANTLLSATLGSVAALIMPTFTYKTMVTPTTGPPHNGITYGNPDLNRMAIPFTHDMPADRLMGILPETLRRHPEATRTGHPILSFTGINANFALSAQTLNNPFAPIDILSKSNGWLLLLGVDHTVNTSIHYAEKLAGQRLFTRWALADNRVVECSGFPGCSFGFENIEKDLKHVTRSTNIGDALIQAVPLLELFTIVKSILKDNPLALLCQREGCERCNAIRG